LHFEGVLVCDPESVDSKSYRPLSVVIPIDGIAWLVRKQIHLMVDIIDGNVEGEITEERSPLIAYLCCRYGVEVCFFRITLILKMYDSW
jgi:hypothetical protein